MIQMKTLGLSAALFLAFCISASAQVSSPVGPGPGPAPPAVLGGEAFYAHAATAQTPTPNVLTKVTLGTVVFDTGAMFASSRFTPQVAGYYQINGTVYAADTTALTIVDGAFYKNGSEYYRFAGFFPASGGGTGEIFSGSAVIYFNGSTDYLELWALANGTAPTFGFATAAVTSALNGSFLHS